MINVDKLNFSYGENKILKNINFSIDKNQFVGIIGPNGSGKSTLLKNISNILNPDSGVIYLNNQLLNQYSSKDLARAMAVVPQETVINFNFTVYDLVMMGRNPYQDRWGRVKDEDRKIIKEALQLTDTMKFESKKLDELSGGEKQRVIIARALAQKPNILLLDEPTSSLDINYQGEIFDLLSYLNKELGITIVAVSHDLNLTSQYCDEIILLNQGEIYISGTPEKVMQEKNINEVYQTEVIIKENPLTSRPYVSLVPGKYKSDQKKKLKDTRIHVICGGGSGNRLLEKLFRKGYQISCGVINQGDSDWEMAKKLDIEMVEIPPFSYINEEASQNNYKLIKKADWVIVADTPFGHGNIDNLKQVSKFDSKNIILLQNKSISERDYTEGEAENMWNRILQKEDTVVVNSEDEILSILKDGED